MGNKPKSYNAFSTVFNQQFVGNGLFSEVNTIRWEKKEKCLTQLSEEGEDKEEKFIFDISLENTLLLKKTMTNQRPTFGPHRH